MIQLEWFFYGWVAGMATPYVVPLIVTCWQEYKIARRDWNRRD